MDIYRVVMYLIPLESWKGAEHCPVDRIGIGRLVVEESDVESKSDSIDTSLITEVNSVDIYRVGTYIYRWKAGKGPNITPLTELEWDIWLLRNLASSLKAPGRSAH